MHVDLDYFFAQCEEVRNPELKTKPVIVCVFSGRTEDSGVVSTANYIARKYGVKSGIPIKLAKTRLKEIPEATFLPLDTPYYSKMSEDAMSLFELYSDELEHAGIDECYLDVSETAADFSSAAEIAQEIKDKVRKKTGLSCSVGVAPNKMLAKIASDLHKPDGLKVIEPEGAADFISKMSVEKIPGIGIKTAIKLQEMGVKTIGELARLDLFKLVEEFGKKGGAFMYNAARGIDDEPVIDSQGKKQIGRIVTLKDDASTSSEMYADLYKLCQSVFEIASSKDVLFGNIGVLLILDDLDQKSKSKSLKIHSGNFETLHSTAKSLLDEAMSGGKKGKVRRLGVRLSDLQSGAGQHTMSQFMGG